MAATNDINTKSVELPIEKDEKLSDQLDLSTIYTIDGKPGLWYCKGFNKNSNMGGFSQWLVEGHNPSVTAHSKNVKRLSNFVFITDKDEEVKFEKVVENLMEAYPDGISDDEFKMRPAHAMAVAVPNYNPDDFKEYHMKKVIKWFNIIAERLNKVNEEK